MILTSSRRREAGAQNGIIDELQQNAPGIDVRGVLQVDGLVK